MAVIPEVEVVAGRGLRAPAGRRRTISNIDRYHPQTLADRYDRTRGFPRLPPLPPKPPGQNRGAAALPSGPGAKFSARVQQKP
jgi:hypothetical protein